MKNGSSSLTVTANNVLQFMSNKKAQSITVHAHASAENNNSGTAGMLTITIFLPFLFADKTLGSRAKLGYIVTIPFPPTASSGACQFIRSKGGGVVYTDLNSLHS